MSVDCNRRSSAGAICRALAVLSLTVVANEAMAQRRTESYPSAPVIVEGIDLTTCNTAVVTGLKRSSGNFLSVRAGPAMSYQRVGGLHGGQDVFTCNERHEWVGIVYGSKGKCRLRTTLSRAPKLPKGCRSGWAHERWIKVTSG